MSVALFCTSTAAFFSPFDPHNFASAVLRTLSGGDEFVAKVFELRIVARGDHGADEQGAAPALATTADEALAAPLPGLAGPGREPDKGRDLSTAE